MPRGGYRACVHRCDESDQSDRSSPYKRDPRERYGQLPASFWASGWHHLLSGTATAILVLLIHREEIVHPKAAQSEPTLFEVWPSNRAMYGVSEDSWRKGTRELARHGLVEIQQGRATHDDASEHGWQRRPHSYRIVRDRFGQLAAAE